MTDWQLSQPTDLEATIAAFKTKLPGWWYSVSECQVSCDASCGPTREAPDHIAMISKDQRFNSGFHVDLIQPSKLAVALQSVMDEALRAIATLKNDSQPGADGVG